MKYGLTIYERIETPIYVPTWADALYWANRIIELGSQCVIAWKEDKKAGTFIATVLYPPHHKLFRAGRWIKEAR